MLGNYLLRKMNKSVKMIVRIRHGNVFIIQTSGSATKKTVTLKARAYFEHTTWIINPSWFHVHLIGNLIRTTTETRIFPILTSCIALICRQIESSISRIHLKEIISLKNQKGQQRKLDFFQLWHHILHAPNLHKWRGPHALKV